MYLNRVGDAYYDQDTGTTYQLLCCPASCADEELKAINTPLVHCTTISAHRIIVTTDSRGALQLRTITKPMVILSETQRYVASEKIVRQKYQISVDIQSLWCFRKQNSRQAGRIGL